MKALEFRLQREILFLRDLARQYKARPELDSVSLLSGRLHACTEVQSPLFQCLPAVACESCFRELLLPWETVFATNARCRTSLHRKQRDNGYRRHRSVGAWTGKIQLLVPSLYVRGSVFYDELILAVQNGAMSARSTTPKTEAMMFASKRLIYPHVDWRGDQRATAKLPFDTRVGR